VSATDQHRILVIDDEADVGNMIGRILRPAPVVFAQSARGALARIIAGGRFAAILCDVRMPGMNGMEFHDEVAKVVPEQARRILYVTASAELPEFQAFVRRTRCPFVEKPFESESLVSAVAVLRSTAEA
jgi:DNA-binding NtrC family response regulator